MSDSHANHTNGSSAGFGTRLDPDQPAFGLLELSSIARGVRTADAAVKQAPSLLLRSRPVSGGKHLVMMRGPVAEVEESMQVARDIAADALIDALELPYLAEPIWPRLEAALWYPEHTRGRIERGLSATASNGDNRDWRDDPAAESVAVVETSTVCAAIAAVDSAIKTAPIVVRDLGLAQGIGGKAFFSFTGILADVEAAAEAAQSAARHRLLGLEIIARPADELRGRLLL